LSVPSQVSNVDAHQESVANPFGMDEDCRNCPELCDTRSQVVHGYGDVGADFAFVGTAPTARTDETGVPFARRDGPSLFDLLGEIGLCENPDADRPQLTGVFCTTLTRCRHPDRGPTDGEIRNCDAFLTAEVRMINPEVLVPVGARALEELAVEYTTSSPEEFDVVADHATSIRGRGFELFPMVPPADQTDEQAAAFVESFRALLASDYRQTKGRRSR